jgi:hypothetical protein
MPNTLSVRPFGIVRSYVGVVMVYDCIMLNDVFVAMDRLVCACSKMVLLMDARKSLDESYNLIAALLCDVSNSHGEVFNTTNLKRTLEKVRERLFAEGMGFLTKTLPRLGKAFDKALSGETKLNANALGYRALSNSELPISR